MPPPNGSIHEVSRLLGLIQGQIEHLNVNVKMRDDAAERQRVELTTKMERLQAQVGETNNTVVMVQQDVAELKNDFSTQQTALQEYKDKQPLGALLIKDVGELKAYIEARKNEAQYEKGFWAAFAWIGKKGWAVIAVLGTGAFAIFLNYGVPYLTELLQRP